MKIAVISINIGDYVVFWEKFYESAEKNFIPEWQKDYFVFTDKEDVLDLKKDNIILIHQEDMGWPYNTMKRFALFRKIIDQLSEYDYVFFANANTEFVQKISTGFIDPQKNIITVEHPGYHYSSIDKKPFENRKESRAFVDNTKRKVYVQGAFYGGRASSFIKMIIELDNGTEEDLNNGIIAIWHDESFLNAYIAKNEDIQILGWQYLYYEEYILPYTPTIMLRNKRDYITNKNGRFRGQNFTLTKIKIMLRNLKWWFLIYIGIYKTQSIYDKNGEYIRNIGD